MQGVDQRQRSVFQEQLDLLKRDPQELQCGNLFQPFQVFQAVEAKTGTSALRFEQTNAIVVVQRSNGYSCQFREFANPVAAVHRSPTIVGPDAASGSSGELPCRNRLNLTGGLHAPRAAKRGIEATECSL